MVANGYDGLDRRVERGIDCEAGLYRVRNRMYHCSLARFLQRDPIAYADASDVYEYLRRKRNPMGGDEERESNGPGAVQYDVTFLVARETYR